MSYNIFDFNQDNIILFEVETLNKIGKKTIALDCTDLVILKWITDNWHSFETYKIDNQYYRHIEYNQIKTDLPILRINKRSCAERLKKLVTFNILKSKFINHNITLFAFDFKFNLIATKLKSEDYNNDINVNKLKSIKTQLNQSLKDFGHVYIFKCGNLYKIGKSRNPQKRFLDFNKPASPMEIVYISKKLLNPYKHEHYLHKLLSKYNLENEWFENLTPTVISEIIKYLESVEIING